MAATSKGAKGLDGPETSNQKTMPKTAEQATLVMNDSTESEVHQLVQGLLASSPKVSEESSTSKIWSIVNRRRGPASPIKTSPEDERDKIRQAYRRRLSTFSPATYFAKPPCLSPIVCARFGWRNTGKPDTLQCEECHATCVVLFPSSSALGKRSSQSLNNLNVALTPQGIERLTYLYQQQLFARGHRRNKKTKQICSFRQPALKYLESLQEESRKYILVDATEAASDREDSLSDLDTCEGQAQPLRLPEILPSPMEAVVSPPQLLRVLEHDESYLSTSLWSERQEYQRKTLIVCFSKLVKHQRNLLLSQQEKSFGRSISPAHHKYGKSDDHIVDDKYEYLLDLPKDVLDFQPHRDVSASPSSMASSEGNACDLDVRDTPKQKKGNILSRISAKVLGGLARKNQDHAVVRRIDELAVALVLFGWCCTSTSNIEGSDKDDRDTSSTGTSLPSLSAECPFCLSLLTLPPPTLPEELDYNSSANDSSSQSEGRPERPRKRQKTQQHQQHRSVLTAHRYYCPYTCGFQLANDNTIDTGTTGHRKPSKPPFRPIWESLVMWLLATPETTVEMTESVARMKATDDVFQSIQQILKSSVSPRLRIKPENA